MRSYETNVYDVSKDGNFQVHLHRMERDDWIVIPENSIGIEVFTALGLIRPDRIVQAKYGLNAYENRKSFWDLNPGLDIPSDVTHIVTNMTGCPYDLKITYYLEITSHPLISRPYVDEFLARDVASINNVRTEQALVFNKWQKDRLCHVGADPSKISVDQRVIDPKVFQTLLPKTLQEQRLAVNEIFFPFRISDPCYRFEKAQSFATRMGKRLVVTDPNESLKDDRFVRKIKPSKYEYYAILMSRPTILYFEDPDFCFHPGLGELIFFGCDIVSPFNIPTFSDILIS